MSLTSFEEFLSSNAIDEVECLVPDITGSARGKILPASKFEKGSKNRGLRIPEDIFILTVTGAYSWKSDATDDASIDVYMKPDPRTVRRVPWYENPTAEVICDCFYLDDRPVDISPRHVLKRVVELYAERDWRPIVAPELEFYLVKKNLDPDYPLESPIGRSGRSEKVGQAYGIEFAAPQGWTTETSMISARSRKSMSTPSAMNRGRPSSRSISIMATRSSSPIRCSCSSEPSARRR